VKFALGRYEDAVARRVADLVSTGAADRIWRRDASFWSSDPAVQARVRERLGWLDAPSAMVAAVPELRAFAADLRRDGFDHAVVLGMGGSSLAPEVLRQAIEADGLTLHVLDTTDPATIRRTARHINPARTLFFVSSKSGTTIEPLALLAYFHDIVRDAKGDRAGENFTAITDAGTPLERFARERGFRRTFVNAADIGGRYSALTYFGLAPAAVAGMDVARLLEQGSAAAESARAPESDALRLGAALGALAFAGRDKVTFIATPEVASFGLWVEQLIAESTGKLGRGIVPVVAEPAGTPLHYGHDRVFVQLRLEVAEAGEDDALVGGYIGEGHPAIIIDIDTPYDLGRLFFDWEFAVAVAGHVIDVNPFDEPNVQESKDNTAAVLTEFERTGRLDDVVEGEAVVALDAAGARVPLADGVARLLSGAASDGYLAINAFVSQTEAADTAFSEIRGAVRDARGLATTLGYGPRYLHSTGQLHKGGTPSGVFLVVTCDAAADVAIPARTHGFGQLYRAQAIGDMRSLAAHGLPVLRVHLGGDVDAALTVLRDAIASAAAPSGVRR
jgi:glucose-6-phosphate isomerase